MATKEQVKGFFAPGKVPKSSDYINLIDLIPDEVSSGGLKQVDLLTYEGTVGEIVEHVGNTVNDQRTANTKGGYVHGHIYEYIGAINENINLPSDTLVINDGYNTKWTDGVCEPDPENNPEWFEGYKTLHPFPWVYDRETKIYQWMGRYNYSHFSVYTKSNYPQVGDNVYIIQGHVGGGYHGQPYSMGTVKTVENTSGNWQYTAIEVQWLGTNGQYESVWYGETDTSVSVNHAGQERSCGVFKAVNGDELVLIGYTPSNIDWARKRCATLNPILDYSGSDMELSYTQGISNYDRFNNVMYDVINTSLYVPTNIPAHWERLIQKPNAVSIVIPLQSGITINGWSGGQYEAVDIESIVRYYEGIIPEIENPNIVSVENAGITNGETLYVRSTACGVNIITPIPYGCAAMFAKSSEEYAYYPILTGLSLTEYELSELANNSGSGYGYGYGYGYSENYGS